MGLIGALSPALVPFSSVNIRDSDGFVEKELRPLLGMRKDREEDKR